ncbi:MAG: nitroreductase family protein [Methanothrix sp.]
MSNDLQRPSRQSPENDVLKNMMLAARSLGMGSCWIGLAAPLGQVQAIMDDLGVLSGCKLEGSLIFGYPVKLDQKAPKREENVVLKWID